MHDVSGLKEERKKRGFNQAEMAEKMGMSAPAYCRKENGLRRFTIEELRSLKEVLSLSDKKFKSIFM